MNSSIVAILIFLTAGLVVAAFLYFRLSFSERTLFKGRVRLLQFILGIILPPLIILPIFQLYRLVERNPFLPLIPVSDDIFLFLIFALIAMASVGNGMHVAGVSIDYPAQNLDSLDEEERAVLRVVEFFHHGFSHITLYLPTTWAFFVFSLFEINHPSVAFLSLPQFSLVVISGLVFGVIAALTMLEGSVWKAIAPFHIFFALVIFLAVRQLGLTFLLLPMTTFILVCYLSSLGFLILWRLYHGGLPEIMGELRVKPGHPKSPKHSRLKPHETTA